MISARSLSILGSRRSMSVCVVGSLQWASSSRSRTVAPASPRNVSSDRLTISGNSSWRRLLTLAQDGELHQVALAGQHIRPRQADDLTAPQLAGICNLD